MATEPGDVNVALLSKHREQPYQASREALGQGEESDVFGRCTVMDPRA
jgi:hypothetical protein